MPFRKLDDLLVPEVLELVPAQVNFLACALHWSPEKWRNEAWMREHMARSAHTEAHIQTVINMIQANDFFIQQHLRGSMERPAQVRMPFQLQQAYLDADTELRLEGDQLRVADNVNKRVDQALAVRHAESDEEADRLMSLAEEHGSMVAVLGPPGTGKTAALDQCIRRAQRLGARVLLAMPTGVQRARVKQRHPDVDLDTCHGAFLFHKPLVEAMGVMLYYDLIVIDEAPQLFEEHFERLDQMWLAAGKLPCMVFAGDEWQLPPPDHSKRSLVHHPQWRLVYKIQLRKVWRQADGDPLLKKLDFLRKNRPMGAEGDAFVRDLCRNRKAWTGHHTPTNLDIEDLFQKTDNRTTVITCTRWGAAHINTLAAEVLFELPKCQKLGKVPADYQSNPDNYDAKGNLQEAQSPAPLQMELYQGLRVRLTRNMAKHMDYVNGMAAEVETFDRRTGAVIVRTETQEVLCIYPITDDNVPAGRVVYYPIRPGYADTVHKFQGAELPHVTFWPDREGCAAAAYVALSRVRKDTDYLLGGCIKAAHFTPAM